MAQWTTRWRWWADLTQPANRYRLYVLVAVLFYGLAWSAAILKAEVKDTSVDFLITDGRGYYGYLPTLIIDGDLDFLNQAHQQYGPKLPRYVQAEIDSDGRMRNKWPIGLALTILPSFLCAHALSWGLYALTGSAAFTPNGLTIVYPLLNVAYLLAVGAAGMMLADRLVVRRYGLDGRVVAAGVLMFWIGTNYAWYYFREPFMSHGVSAAWVTAAVFLIDGILRGLDRRQLAGWQLPMLAFATSMALVCRYTNVFLLPFFVYLLLRLVREGHAPRVLRQTPALVAALLPLILQAVVVRAMNEGAVEAGVQAVGYSSHERFYWTEPALLSTLFSSRHGLFFWSPVFLWSAWGLVWHMGVRRRGRDPWLVCFLLSAGILWYLNSAWWAWWFGPAVGGRAFLELQALFIVGLCFGFEFYRRAGRGVRSVIVVGLVLAVGVNWALMALRMVGAISQDGYLLAW